MKSEKNILFKKIEKTEMNLELTFNLKLEEKDLSQKAKAELWKIEPFLNLWAFEILNITAEAKLSLQPALNPINHDEREVLEPEAK